MKEVQTNADLSSVRGYRQAPVNRRTKRNRALHKRNVLETAARLFMERGYAGTSMADVAAALQIGRTSLYYYFESKEQILSSLVEEVTVSINTTATSLTSMSGTPDQLLRELVRRHVEFIAQNGTIFRVLTNSQMYLTDELKEINNAAKNGIYRNFRKVIAQGVEDGTFRPLPPPSPHSPSSACATGYPPGSSPTRIFQSKKSERLSPTWRWTPSKPAIPSNRTKKSIQPSPKQDRPLTNSRRFCAPHESITGIKCIT